jgi:ABC-type glycerol-3-phosphate transport system substrate-binding protein
MTEGTTDGYTEIIKGFKTTYPEYKNTNIVFGKYGSYTQYKKLLQSSLADGTGPDIFTVYAGADIVLEGKLEAIPSPIIDTDSFITRYDSIFADMVVDNPEYKKDPLLPKAYIK